LEKKDISQIELVGGVSRIPKVHSILKEYFKRDNLDFHLNGDEAAAFGAALFGRIWNRVTPIKIKDYIDWNVSLDVENQIILKKEDNEENDDQNSKHITIFPKGTRLGAKKRLQLIHDGSITISMKYDLSPEDKLLFPSDIRPDLEKYEVSGLPKDHVYNLTATPKVSLTFHLTSSGTFELDRAEVNISYTEKVIPKKPKEKIKKIDEKNETDTKDSDTKDSDTKDSDSKDSDTTEPDSEKGDDNFENEEKEFDDKDTSTNKDSTEKK